MTVLDIFSGLGGWDVAARELGFEPVSTRVTVLKTIVRSSAA
jgi:hypothetical protein